MQVLKLLAIFCFLFLAFFLFPVNTKAANEFSSSYTVTYSVSEDGATEVEEDISLTNLTDKFFPSSFSLILPGSGVSGITASDSQGNLETQTENQENSTKLTVKFTNQQIIGIGKEYSFTLKFKDKQVAKKTGKVWILNIPKINQQEEVSNFDLTVSVPTSFGDPDYISPKPLAVNEIGGKIDFEFAPDALLQSGISAIFGETQNFSFISQYDLANYSIFPKYFRIPLVLKSPYQKAFIENIDPKPENSQTDKCGNSLALYKLNVGEKLNVKVTGIVQTYLKSLSKEILSSRDKEIYLEGGKFWDVNNPVIKTKVSELLEGKNSLSNLEKAKEIDKFVSNFLQFDYLRPGKNDYLRFGSVTALNNPEKALTSEFVDLEIAFLRSAGIPARQVIGFSVAQEGKPFAYKNNNLHSWVEIYDEQVGWIISDPAWENTTKGTNLFNFNDLSHLGLTYENDDPNFILPGKIDTAVFEGEVSEKKGAELDVKVNSEILSGLPSKAKIRINNLGNTAFPASELKLDTSKILLEGFEKEPSITLAINTPEIPPFGNLEYDINLKTGAIWRSYQDAFQVTFAGATDTRIITVSPILSYKIFAVEIFGALTIIVLFYVLVFLIHYKSSKNS